MDQNSQSEQFTPPNTGSVIVAGPTNPLSSKRITTIKPTKFIDEPLDLQCEWSDCNFSTHILNDFMDHVTCHTPVIEINFLKDAKKNEVLLKCNWNLCPYKVQHSEDLMRHLYLHAYHTKLKCIGTNTRIRSELNPCKADSSNRNILPDLSENLVCAWGNCSEIFVNIQLYYDHIRGHCDSEKKGRNVPGGIECKWGGCGILFCNITKLRDHMRSHTQEKLLACPNCGALFANRTRYFDHCRRQVQLGVTYSCEACMKEFPTARLLREHIRSHINTYQCSMCDMTCTSPSGLNAHIKYRHTSEKPFHCEFCTHSAKSQSDLLRHTKSHMVSTLKCEVEGCSYKSKAMTAINYHWERVHSNDNPRTYICHECQKRYTKGWYLTKHLISAHKLQWPSGHSRFRYKAGDDGLYRLLTLRYESIDVPDRIDEELEDIGDILPH